MFTITQKFSRDSSAIGAERRWQIQPGEFRSNRMSSASTTTKTSADSAMPRLRIAQIGPLYERIPPKLYGGTERIVSYITEELVRRGHDVTLFAAGDAVTSAKLHPACPQALRLAGKQDLGAFLQFPMLSDVYENADDFDVIHNHIDYWSFGFARLVNTPTVSTMHGRLDLEDLMPVYARYKTVPLVSISDAQRPPLPFMNWVSTVYHGLPRDLLTFSKGPGKYLAFLGRISPEKGPDLAIDVARKAGIPIKLAAKVDVVDRAYFDQVIKPRLSSPNVEYVGEINESQKNEFLGNALALMFTIDWPEPFGLAMIEALACGAPVIARPCGSVPEVLRNGVSGIIASEFDDLVQAVKNIDSVSREACRKEFETRFTDDVMATQYERIYRELISARRNGSHPRTRFEEGRSASR
jgi:glycosyltransferase involved in cell wall biosynthesis